MQFENKWNQLALLLILFGINIIIFSLIARFTAELFFGPDALGSTPALRYINSFAQIGTFGLTAWLFAYFVNNKKPVSYLQINKGISLMQCILLILIFTVSTPALSSIIEWNANIRLPEFMSSIENWMREQEDSAAETTAKLLAGKGTGILLINLFTVALIPAICEELLFRGAVLGWLRNSLKNIHLAVFFSAFIFSAFHLQFYGFVPRLLLGLYLGYILIWTGSMWSSIIAHFINNSMAVIAAYLYNNQLIDIDYSDFGNVGNNYILIITSILLTTLCLYFLYKKRKLNVEC
jgi:membrane protease YdiL (CAAX protease family)